MKSGLAILGLCALILVGCGGGDDNKNGRGEVSGIIFDEEGIPVRDAHVYFDGPNQEDRNVQSNSNGVYLLTDMPEGDHIIRVEVTRSGNRFFGSNVARILGGERTQNHNIAVYPDNRLSSIEGFVRDRQGFLLQGVRVFARQRATNTVLTSSYGVTDGDGHFVIGGLRSNLTYDVQVNALDYNSDFDAVTLDPGERRRMDFTVPLAEDITLDAPSNVVATAWTSPKTRAAAWDDVLQNMKNIVKPENKSKKKAKVESRLTAGGNFIEVDILWDPIVDSALLGFGFYRSDGGGSLRDIYFLRDPLAELFADMDDNLREGRTYNYRVTSISTIGNESDFSNAASATPLGDLVLRQASASSRPTFRWDAAFGADEYAVYLFDHYPSIGVQDFWNNAENPTANTSYAYDGPALGSGRYYYIVVGMSDAGHFTLSPVGDFVVP